MSRPLANRITPLVLRGFVVANHNANCCSFARRTYGDRHDGSLPGISCVASRPLTLRVAGRS